MLMKLEVRKLTAGASDVFPSAEICWDDGRSWEEEKSRQLSRAEVTRIQADGHERSRRRQEKLSGANFKGGGRS